MKYKLKKDEANKLEGAKKIISYAIKNAYLYGDAGQRLLRYIERVGKKHSL